MSTGQLEHEFVVSDPSLPAVESFRKAVESAGAKVTVCDANAALVKVCEIVIIAVKPQLIEPALAEVSTSSRS